MISVSYTVSLWHFYLTKNTLCPTIFFSLSGRNVVFQNIYHLSWHCCWVETMFQHWDQSGDSILQNSGFYFVCLFSFQFENYTNVLSIYLSKLLRNFKSSQLLIQISKNAVFTSSASDYISSWLMFLKINSSTHCNS